MESSPHPDVSESPTPSACEIDPRIIKIWRFVAITALGVPLVPLAVASIAVVWAFSDFWITAAFAAVWLVMTAIGFFCVWQLPRITHARWRYKLDPRVFESRHGVVWQSSISIPISRLQHVDLHRGPLERRYGLASLELHTAGTRNASHTIPGLDVSVAEELRDRLVRLANAEKQK